MPKGHPLGVEDIGSFQNPRALLELCHTGQKQGTGVRDSCRTTTPHILSSPSSVLGADCTQGET